MKMMIYVCLASLLSPLAMNAQQKLPTAAPMLSPSICGKAVYDLWLGDKPVGREEFEIKCKPDGGYQASGHTELKPAGAAIDLNTTLEVDKSGEPLSSTAKGTVNGSPFDQSVVVKGATTTITTGASIKELPFAKGSSLVGGNIFYMNQFLLARYDAARGGVQELPIFPNLTARVERVARDEVQATGISAAPAPIAFDRYSVTIAVTNVIAWVDSKGRLAVLAVPLQNFAAVREDCANSHSFIQSDSIRQDEGVRSRLQSSGGRALHRGRSHGRSKGLQARRHAAHSDHRQAALPCCRHHHRIGSADSR